MDNFKKLKSSPVFLALMIGLAGSFIWEKILSPIFGVLFDKFLTYSGRLSILISKSTYTQISNGLSETGTTLIFSVIFSAFIGFTMYIVHIAYRNLLAARALVRDIQSPTDNVEEDKQATSNNLSLNQEKNNLNKKLVKNIYKLHEIESQIYDIQVKLTKRVLITVCFVAALFILIFSCIFTKYIYVQTNIVRLTNNIEIVSPYISDQEYKILKSEFHSMQSRKDYDDLNLKLESISKENSIRIKK